eukprot:g5450.t1
MSRFENQDDVEDKEVGFFTFPDGDGNVDGYEEEEEEGEDEWIDQEIEKLEALQKILVENLAFTFGSSFVAMYFISKLANSMGITGVLFKNGFLTPKFFGVWVPTWLKFW